MISLGSSLIFLRTGMCHEAGNVEQTVSCLDHKLWFVHFRVRVRYQKRQKLQFETKLGMNSPFWWLSVWGSWRQGNYWEQVRKPGKGRVQTLQCRPLSLQPRSTSTIRWSRATIHSTLSGEQVKDHFKEASATEHKRPRDFIACF